MFILQLKTAGGAAFSAMVLLYAVLRRERLWQILWPRAPLLVVPAKGKPWQALADLRVDDNPDPIEELGRLLDLHDAYELANEADELAGAGRHEEAGERYRRACELAPDSAELLFWGGLGRAQQGELEEGAELVRRAIDAYEGWRELLARLGPEIAPSAEAVRGELGVERAAS